MPLELRKLVFPHDELQAAAISHCLRAKVTLPGMPLKTLEVRADAEAALVMRFETDNPALPREVVLNRDHAVAALIRFCRDRGIPLPRRGQKMLQPDARGGALLIRVDRQPIAKPATSKRPWWEADKKA